MSKKHELDHAIDVADDVMERTYKNFCDQDDDRRTDEKALAVAKTSYSVCNSLRTGSHLRRQKNGTIRLGARI